MPTIESGDYPSGLVAEVFKPQGAADTGALRVARKGRLLYDSGDVAAGAVINTGALELTGVEHLFFKVINSDGVSARNFTMTERDEAGAALGSALTIISVPAATTHRGTMGQGVSVGTLLSWSIPGPPPAKALFQLTAGGTSNGRVLIWGR